MRLNRCQPAVVTGVALNTTTLTLEVGNSASLTANSYVDNVILTNGAVINKNGYTLIYTTLNNTSGTIND